MKTTALAAIVILSIAAPMHAECGPAKQVSVEEAAKMLGEKKEIVVLDIRTEAEFKTGHIAGAKNIDFQAADFAQKISELDKSKTYLVHCAGGGRSGRSMEVFAAQKFPSILHLNEGFKAWVAAAKPVEK